MLDLKQRLENIETYCSKEYDYLYDKLKQCRDRAINMCRIEYINGEQEHEYSNLYSCIYDFKKENGILNSMEELMQLMKDIDFNINKKFQVHNFKVANHIPLCKGE